MAEKADRVKLLAEALGLALSEAEIAALAEPLCGLIDAVDEPCADFEIDAPEPFARSHAIGPR